MAKRKAKSEDIGSLLSEWEQEDDRFRQDAYDEGTLPGLDEVQAFEILTAKLSAWCDQSPVGFDPTPLLAVSDLVRSVVKSAPLACMAVEVPVSLLREWSDSRQPALLLIRRIQIWLESTGGKPETQPPKTSKDAQAIALMLSMEKPTKNKIARALGYTDGNALRHFSKFQEAWDKFEIMKTVTGGNGRSIVNRDESAYHDDD